MERKKEPEAVRPTSSSCPATDMIKIIISIVIIIIIITIIIVVVIVQMVVIQPVLLARQQL